MVHQAYNPVPKLGCVVLRFFEIIFAGVIIDQIQHEHANYPPIERLRRPKELWEHLAQISAIVLIIVAFVDFVVLLCWGGLDSIFLYTRFYSPRFLLAVVMAIDLSFGIIFAIVVGITAQQPRCGFVRDCSKYASSQSNSTNTTNPLYHDAWAICDACYSTIGMIVFLLSMIILSIGLRPLLKLNQARFLALTEVYAKGHRLLFYKWFSLRDRGWRLYYWPPQWLSLFKFLRPDLLGEWESNPPQPTTLENLATRTQVPTNDQSRQENTSHPTT